MDARRASDPPAQCLGAAAAAAMHDASSERRHRQNSPDTSHSRHARGSRSRASSRYPSPSPLRLSTAAPALPLNDGIASAIDRADMPSRVDPELVALVTSQVIRSLKVQGIGAAAPGSVNTASSAPPPRNVYTPPSPTRSEDVLRPMDPALEHADQTLDGASRRSSMYSSSLPSRSGFTERRESRPSPVARETSIEDPSPLERIWQPLFDDKGNPTPRLAQFLRGLAVHIIEDFDPMNSLAVTPEKMKRFYEVTALPDEIYPWSAIFGGRISHSSLSHLYRDLKCEQCFVQRLGAFDDKPSIPALTPYGFEVWFTNAIRSHPELEWRRFSKAVLSMPISNFYDRKERFPKELPRKLFPNCADHRIRDYFEDSILADANISLLPPPTHTTTTPSAGCDRSRSTSQGSSRATTATTREQAGPTAGPIDYMDELRPTVSIERERKPYSAQPGGGKQYESSSLDSSRHTVLDGRPQRSNTGSSSNGSRTGTDDGLGCKTRTGSGCPPGANNRREGRRPARSQSRSGRVGHINSYTRSEDSVHAGPFGGGSASDEDNRHRTLEAKEQERASIARQYVMEETQRSGMAADEDYHRRRRQSLSAGAASVAAPPPPPPPPPPSAART